MGGTFVRGGPSASNCGYQESEVHHWFDWARTHVPPNAFQSLGVPVWSPDDHSYSYVNDRNLGSKHWYVSERAVPSAEWVSVMNIETGEVLWRAPAQWPTGSRALTSFLVTRL